MKVKEKLLNFWAVFMLFSIIIFLFFLVITHYWEFFASILGLTEVEYLSGKVTEPGKFLDAISNSLGLLIGAPVALAGSFVAIVLAQRALAVSERQEFNDNVNLIDEKVNELINTLSDLSKEYRCFSNNVQKLQNCYLDKLFNHDNYEHTEFLGLAKQVEKSQENFVHKFIHAMKNPTINEYIKDRKSDMTINRFLETVFLKNSCQYDEVGEQKLFQISDVSELAFKMEFSFSADNYEHQLDEYFSGVSFSYFDDNKQFLKDNFGDEVDENSSSYGFKYMSNFSTFEERIKESVLASSPEDLFLQGALFEYEKYFLYKPRSEPLLSVSGVEYFPYSEFKNFDFYDPEESYVWNETELIVSNLNLGSEFILEFINIYNMGTEKLKTLFINSNHLRFVEDNKKLKQLINQQFSTIDISIFLPKRIFEYADFIEHYELFAFADSKFVGMYEKFDYAKKNKDKNESWPDDNENYITSEEIRIKTLFSGTEQNFYKNKTTDIESENLPF